jgi:hypothetical protein
VISADDVETLLFDVLGTVVDEAGSMRAELRRFAALVSSIGEGAPWRSTDDLNAEALADVLRDGPPLPEATVRHLGLVGHRLRPWPRAAAAPLGITVLRPAR